MPQGRVACPLKKVTEYIMYGGVGWDVCNEGGERARESERYLYIYITYMTCQASVLPCAKVKNGNIQTKWHLGNYIYIYT